MGQVNTFTQARIVPAMFPEDMRQLPVRFAANLVLGKGRIVAQVTSAAASEVQTLTPGGTLSGGTYTLIVSGAQTDPLAFNANAAAIKAAIEAALTRVYGLPSGTVNVTGGPLNSGVATVTFTGACANQPQPLIQVINALTGAAPTVTVARTTPGVAQYAFADYNDALATGQQIAKAILPVDIATDPSGRITLGSAPYGSERGGTFNDHAVIIRGIYKTTDLVGLDANGVTDLGRLIMGSVADGLLQLY